MALQVAQKTQDGNCVVTASGEIDLSSSPKLRQALLAAIDDYDTVQVHLTEIAYMDSSGVATLVEALKASRAKSRKFELVSPSTSVLKVLQLARLDALFTIVASET